MVRISKESTERFYLRILRKQLDDLPPGDPVKGERPDFLWPQLQQPLGLEVTRLFAGSAIQESEKMLVVDEASRMYERQGLPQVDVRVIFGSQEIRKSKRRAIAERLANTVASNLPTVNSWFTLENSCDYKSGLPIEISSVSISRMESLQRNHWSVTDAGWIRQNFIDELQQAIDRKGALFEDYLMKCSRCWLMVVADGDGASSLFEPNESTAKNTYKSPFQKTFFVSAFTRKLIRLNTSVFEGTPLASPL